jgi:hypothetical protein
MSGERTLEDWAADDCLYHRLRESVRTFARGAGNWNERARSLFERIGPLRSIDFPPEYQDLFNVLFEAHDASVIRDGHRPIVSTSWMTANRRARLVDSLFTLYEEMTKARSIIGL